MISKCTFFKGAECGITSIAVSSHSQNCSKIRPVVGVPFLCHKTAETGVEKMFYGTFERFREC